MGTQGSGMDEVRAATGATKDRLAILLLPGMDGTGKLLAELAGPLRQRRDVVVITYPADQPLGYAPLTALVLEQVPKGRFIVLGESFAGPIAIEIAAQRPAQVKGLILASTFARHPLPRSLAWTAALLEPAVIPKVAINAVLLGKSGTPALKDLLARTLRDVPAPTLQARARAALTVDVRQQLASVKCPILCLVGRQDRLTGERCVRDIVAASPHTRVQRLDAPHMLLETNAPEAARCIETFCSEQDAACAFVDTPGEGG